MKSICLASAIVVLLSTQPAAAAGIVRVTPSDFQTWHFYAGPPTCSGPGPTTASVSFVHGPAAPPIGNGSVQFGIGSNASSFLVNLDDALNGVLLRDLTVLQYSSFIVSANGLATGQQAPRLFMELDLNGDGTQFEQIVFEPAMQTSQGPVVLGAWQTWDAIAGGWWNFLSPRSAPVLQTLSAIAAAHPAAVIRGTGQVGFAILVGCESGDWTDFRASVDDLRIGIGNDVTITDFETFDVPAMSPWVLLLLAAALALVALRASS